MIKLTACMIARNEEAMIGRALASVADGVDEIVVVDTGSDDRTRSIAREHGAVVIDWAWRDSFAAARNVAIEHATGDWILMIDADHAYVPGDVAKLRRTLSESEPLKSPEVQAVAILQLDAKTLESSVVDVVSGAEAEGEPTMVIALMRNLPHVRYAGDIHESVLPAVEAAGGRRAAIGMRVAHYGAVQSLRDARGKDARNEHLLLKRLEADDGDVEAAGYLSIMLYHQQRLGELDVLQTMTEPAFLAGPRLDLRFGLTRIIRLYEREQYDAALDAVGDLREDVRRHPDVCFLAGLACQRRGKPDEAYGCFRGAIAARDKLFAQVFLEDTRTWRAPLGLAECCRQMGRTAEAREWFDDAIARATSDEVRARIVLERGTLAAA